MIDLKVVKAILAFYLDTKRVDWKLISGETIKYPEAKTTERDKLDFICRLVAKVKSITKILDDKKAALALIELSKTLLDQANIEAANHRSASMNSLARHFTDYPALSKVILAVRSYCLSCAYEVDYAGKDEESVQKEIETLQAQLSAATEEDAKKELTEKLNKLQADLTMLKDMHYYRLFTGEQGDGAGFVDIIKYEDNLHGPKNYGEKKFQDIASFNVFFDKYTALSYCFKLLDGLMTIHHKLLTLGTATSVTTLSLVSNDEKQKPAVQTASVESEKVAGMGNK